MFFFGIWVAHPFCSKAYTYAYDYELSLYTVVSVMFGTKKCFGVIVSKEEPIFSYKKVLACHNFIISEKFFSFIIKFSSYYFLKLGAVLEMVFPIIAFQKSLPILLSFRKKNYALIDLLNILSLKEIKKLSAGKFEQKSLKKTQNMDDISNDDTSLNNDNMKEERVFSMSLSDDQKEAISFINASLKVCVLEGVTGSGKTIVALESVKFFDKKILILVPEINLINNWSQLIKNRFGVTAFVFHSKVSKIFKKSFFNWAISDSPGFIIGTRSSLMIPYKNLCYIIVDEEHSSSYRQDSYPYYNARDMAILLADCIKINVLLISATLSLETIYNIKKNKYDHFKLSRTPKHGLASVHYIKGSPSAILATEILEQVSKCLKNNQQVLFFLNRKGYVPYCFCNQCRNLLLCSGCDCALTLYVGYHIICNKCFKKSFLPKICPYCKVYTTWSFYGIGVQKLHEFLSNYFPNSVFSIVTSESDNISSQLDDIQSNRVNGIIATQILAQGHDFKNISLIVVVDADMGLVSTDFRVMEKIYQLWQQIRGRSGRHNIKGDMILQYLKKDNKFLLLFRREDIISFLLKDRLEGDWPPFSKCAFLKFKGRDKDKLEKIVESISLDHNNIFGPLFWGVKNKVFEFRFLVKAKNHSILRSYLYPIIQKFKKCEVEIDPY